MLDLVFNSANNLVVNGSICGAGSVTQENTNTVILNGVNTFTGPLQIRAGVLQLGDGASIGGTTTIQLFNGAVMDVSAVAGGFVSQWFPNARRCGQCVGRCHRERHGKSRTAGNFELCQRALRYPARWLWKSTAPITPSADLISATTLSFGGTLTVTNLGGALQAGDSFQLFSGSITGMFAATNLPALLPTNLFWDASKLNSQGIISVALEPAATPTILPPSRNGTNLILQAGSQTGFNYVLQSTAQLAPADWTPIQTNAGGGLLTFIIPVNGGSQQFFRLCVQ